MFKLLNSPGVRGGTSPWQLLLPDLKKIDLKWRLLSRSAPRPNRHNRLKACSIFDISLICNPLHEFFM